MATSSSPRRARRASWLALASAWPQNCAVPRLFKSPDTHPILSDPLASAIASAQQNLIRLQHPEGYWCGELFVDSTLCSDYVLFMHWADEVDPVLEEKCVAHIRSRQLDDGGWNIYEGGPSEVSASIKAYFA